MSKAARAAQFAPFAALVGFEECIRESARITEKRAELAADRIAEINETLVELFNDGFSKSVRIVYYESDKRKAGGAYLTFSGRILGYMQTEASLLCSGGKKIAINDIFDIRSE